MVLSSEIDTEIESESEIETKVLGTEVSECVRVCFVCAALFRIYFPNGFFYFFVILRNLTENKTKVLT